MHNYERCDGENLGERIGICVLFYCLECLPCCRLFADTIVLPDNWDLSF